MSSENLKLQIFITPMVICGSKVFAMTSSIIKLKRQIESIAVFMMTRFSVNSYYVIKNSTNYRSLAITTCAHAK